MIYRITIVLPRDNEPGFSPEECLQKVIANLGWSLEAALCMESLGLPAPRKFSNLKARFYFTKFGWNQIGRYVAAELRKHEYEVLISNRKNPLKSEVVYQDPYQLAVLPSRSGNRQPRRKKKQ